MNTSSSDPAPRRHLVLVAVALDDTSDWALLEGAELVRSRPGSELHVVHAIEQASSSELLSLDRRLEDAPRRMQQRIESLWAQTDPLHVVAHLGIGDPVKLILQTANDVEADVIVIGSHRRTGLEKWVLGSVAQSVLRAASCPVLVALPRNYEGAHKSAHVDAACSECSAARSRSVEATYWCERHAKHYLTPHIYRPRDSVAPRRSIVPGML